MVKLSFVIGATATGKTYYIDHHFTDEMSVVLNIYDGFAVTMISCWQIIYISILKYLRRKEEAYNRMV